MRGSGGVGDGEAGRWWTRRWSLPLVSLLTVIVQVMGTWMVAASARWAAAGHAQHWGGWQGAPHDVLPPGSVALLVAGPVALLFRLRFPVPTLLVTVAIQVTYMVIGFPAGPTFLAMAIAFLSAIASGNRVVAWIAGAVGYVAYVGLSLLVHGTGVFKIGPLSDYAIGLVVILVLAEIHKVQQDWVRERRRNRIEQERRQNSEERLRIAQELHDVLAHNISLINVQAGVALHLIDQRPEQARTALAAIKQASKETLSEMRSALEVLRNGDQAPRAPTAGLSRLTELVERMRAAGQPVRTIMEGEPRDLPVGVDLAAYRVIQEALTNVYRHAHASTGVVLVDYRPDALVVQIDDDGTAAPAAATDELVGGGNGIPGMRERAAALGGSLEAGPRPGGGFRVRARFPRQEPE